METKINPLNVFSLQVNHNFSEIRRLFNSEIERMGNRRKKKGVGGRGGGVAGGGGRMEGWSRLRNFKPNQKYDTNQQLQ